MKNIAISIIPVLDEQFPENRKDLQQAYHKPALVLMPSQTMIPTTATKG